MNKQIPQNIKEKTSVMIVESAEEYRFLINNCLTNLGYEVFVYDNPILALDHLDQNPVDILISDIIIPEMDGIELCSIVKSRFKYIYFVLLTSKDTLKDKIEGLNIGADEYITKPFHFTELIARVKAAERIVLSQKELLKLNERLLILNELKNQFLGMATHDLRNPLTLISSFSEMLLDYKSENLNLNQIEMISRIQTNTKTMIALINDLLDITAIESGKIDVLKSSTAIEDVLDITTYASKLMADKKKISLTLNIEANLPEIFVDLDRMHQVFENLISNAVKFSHQNTQITIQAIKNNDNIEISVIDQGQGIPASELNKIFKPFHKTTIKPTGSEISTGLGLAIVKKILDLHDALIEVDSKFTKGSVFRVIIPIKS